MWLFSFFMLTFESQCFLLKTTSNLIRGNKSKKITIWRYTKGIQHWNLFLETNMISLMSENASSSAHVRAQSCLSLCGPPCTVAISLPPLTEFSRQECWVGYHFMLKGFPGFRIRPVSPLSLARHFSSHHWATGNPTRILRVPWRLQWRVSCPRQLGVWVRKDVALSKLQPTWTPAFPDGKNWLHRVLVWLRWLRGPSPGQIIRIHWSLQGPVCKRHWSLCFLTLLSFPSPFLSPLTKRQTYHWIWGQNLNSESSQELFS